MKKKLSLITALVMTLTLMLSFSAVAAFTAPNYDPANITEDIGLMLANDITYEGVVGIQTSGTFTSAWRNAVLFELDSETGAYKAIEVHASAATGPNWTIGENQFVVDANVGNNWPELFASATGNEWFYNASNGQSVPYKEKAWGTIIASVQVGDLYALVGVDIANPAIIANYPVDETYAYITNNANYKTYSYLTPYIEGVTNTSKNDPGTPGTGDIKIIFFVILSVVTLAGTVVVAKKR